ncbi:MAG: RNA polymerase sigma factor [Gemmatimonadota bacterium]|nr:RNA polymerase sigma factor [Gemmatimonadota bacterium]
MKGSGDVTAVAQLVRELAPRVLGAVSHRYGDFPDAEDAVQEALVAASEQWPSAGVPGNPAGWLYQVAVRRLADMHRADSARYRREEIVAAERILAGPFVAPKDDEIGAEADDSLVLLFMCSHPALTTSSAIALTLRAVGGLGTAEIASAFMVPEATMAQRISRAKQTIRTSGIAFAMPDRSESEQRLGAVLHVLYLMFNEGYAGSSGASLVRVDLSNEAIRLARMLHVRFPDDTEVAGLLGLMLLTDARRAARTGPVGELIPLDEQDRGAWDRTMIGDGLSYVADRVSGPYQLQAAIAALHDVAPSSETTDWKGILTLYQRLESMSDNPMITLNRIVAESMVRSAAVGLKLLDGLQNDSRIAGHYRLDAIRAHLLERSGDVESAITHFRAAAERTSSIPERRFLLEKATRLTQS